MRIGTIVSLGASAVLGIGALFVAKVMLPQAAGHAQAGKAEAAEVQTVPVVVATAALAYGAKLEADKLTVAHLPPSAAPAGAYATVAQVMGQSGGAPIVLVPIAAREPVLPTKLSGGGAKPTVASMIPEGMRAYTIGVSDVAGGGGHILPGDRIDVVLTRDLSQSAGSENAGGSGKRLISNIVIQNVRVLGMDLNADPNSTQAAIAHTATLEVSMEDAEKLALASQAGTLTMALRRTGAAEVTPSRVIADHDLGPAGGAVRAASGPRPAVRRAPAAYRPAAEPARRSISVFHGDTKSSVEVPSERGGPGA